MKTRNIRKSIAIALAVIVAIVLLLALGGSSCGTPQSGAAADASKTIDAGDKLQDAQSTPTDISYSIPRYLLAKRAYFLSGQRDKANALPSPIADLPLGYATIMTSSGAVIGNFPVIGMVVSLRTYLTPDSEYYEKNGSSIDGRHANKWLPDIDGTYGENADGIFFFELDGTYHEFINVTAHYSDQPMKADNPILKTEGTQ